MSRYFAIFLMIASLRECSDDAFVFHLQMSWVYLVLFACRPHSRASIVDASIRDRGTEGTVFSTHTIFSLSETVLIFSRGLFAD